MTSNKLKIFNDPIYGFITIPNSQIFDLIEHKYFQRLRRINQMGLSYLVYPGANHTRFHHAIGCIHLMQKAINVLRFKDVTISEEEEQALQITMRFFIDDVENTLESRYDTELELDTPAEAKNSDFYIQKYLAQKFKITVNDQLVKLNYIGKEYNNDVVYFYLEALHIDSIKSIEVESKMLYEEFPDQENFIKLNVKNIKKTYILIKEKDKEMLKLT